MSKVSSIRVIVLAGLFTAIAVVLGGFKIPITNLVEIRFQSIPVKLAGALLGPYLGGIVGALTDILAYLVKPTGPFFPGFTLSSLATGVIFAFFLHGKKFALPRVIAAEAVITGAIGLCLNSFWLSLLYKTPFLVSVISRAPKELIMLPINIALVYGAGKAVSGVMGKIEQ